MIVGVGCDIVEISRIKMAIKDKILSQSELHYCQGFGEKRMIEFLAGRFALKEAIVKAINEKIVLSDIEVKLENSELQCSYKDYVIKGSIAHEKAYAVAFVVVER